MGKVRAWSFSSLDTFKTCQRKYHEESVLKSVSYEETEAQRYGTWVHKMFEERLGPGRVPLVKELAQHEPLMQEIEERGGSILTERKVGLDRQLRPCEFFDKAIWWRGVLDVDQRLGDGRASHVDYKTGKPHTKVLQLQLGALHMMQSDPSIMEVDCMFYWTKTSTKTRFTMKRSGIPAMLSGMTPDLNAWVKAFKDDQFLPKPNGLCKDYCGVEGCEFKGRGMQRR